MSDSALFSPNQPNPTRNSIVSGYRSLAARCKRDAEQAGSPEFRDKLLVMAEQWDVLASKNESSYWPA